jgi:hypothetical protein
MAKKKFEALDNLGNSNNKTLSKEEIQNNNRDNNVKYVQTAFNLTDSQILKLKEMKFKLERNFRDRPQLSSISMSELVRIAVNDLFERVEENFDDPVKLIKILKK